MPDTVVEQLDAPIQVNLGDTARDPFLDWSDTPPVIPEPSTQTQQPAATTTTTAPATTTTTEESSEETFDEATYLKNNFGWESSDAAKTELERLRNLEKNPVREEIKYDNEDSKRIHQLIKEKKFPELREYLNQQDRLDRLSGYDLSKADQAAEVLKTHMRLKNPDLSEEDVDHYINKKFRLPQKPQNNLDLTDAENEAAMASWQEQVNEIHRDMMIEAKLVKPELSKFKSELILPDIQAPVDPSIAEAQQKELQQQQAQRENYLKVLESDYKNFNGFNVGYKDEDVEYAVSFVPTDEEKVALKEELKDFNLNSFFDKEWFDDKGNPKTDRIMADLYFLKNREKIFQKFVNESARQRLAALKKDRANITVGTTSQGTFEPDNRTEMQKQEDAIWRA